MPGPDHQVVGEMQESWGLTSVKKNSSPSCIARGYGDSNQQEMLEIERLGSCVINFISGFHLLYSFVPTVRLKET